MSNNDYFEKFILRVKKMREIQIKLQDRNNYPSVISKQPDIHRARTIEGEVDSMIVKLEARLRQDEING